MLAAFAVLALLPPQDTRPLSEPATAAERSGWRETSRQKDVEEFLQALAVPGGRVRVQTFGRTTEGRPLLLAVAGDPCPKDDAAVLASGRLRVLVNANIHGGEVEGKEVALGLLREVARGEHAELLRDVVLLVVPNFNADGNERIDPRNRVAQNGPAAGVGRRENAGGHDLNRDFVKLETPEGIALVGLMNRLDPHVLLDLHTTNGSHHGYHVTTATSLAVNVDPGLRRFATEFLDQLRADLAAQHGVRAFHYGNFELRDGKRAWVTFDHRPRYLTNYYGLRNRLAVLSEAYSYLGFERRAWATRALVLATLRLAVQRRRALEDVCAHADRVPPLLFGTDARLAPAYEAEVLVGEVERVRLPDGLGTRVVMLEDRVRAERMPVQSGFVAGRTLAIPDAWLVVAPTDETLRVLSLHGIEMRALTEPWRGSAELFTPTKFEAAGRPFQGHRPRTVQGRWQLRETEVAKGSYLVPAVQRLGRLAAQLLEPESEDSLATWNHFDAAVRVAPQEENPLLVLAGAAPASEARMEYPVARAAPPLAERRWAFRLAHEPQAEGGLSLSHGLRVLSGRGAIVREVQALLAADRAQHRGADEPGSDGGPYAPPSAVLVVGPRVDEPLAREALRLLQGLGFPHVWVR